jgi:hypothetical protein
VHFLSPQAPEVLSSFQHSCNFSSSGFYPHPINARISTPEKAGDRAVAPVFLALLVMRVIFPFAPPQQKLLPVCYVLPYRFCAPAQVLVKPVAANQRHVPPFITCLSPFPHFPDPEPHF